MPARKRRQGTSPLSPDTDIEGAFDEGCEFGWVKGNPITRYEIFRSSEGHVCACGQIRKIARLFQSSGNDVGERIAWSGINFSRSHRGKKFHVGTVEITLLGFVAGAGKIEREPLVRAALINFCRISYAKTSNRQRNIDIVIKLSLQSNHNRYQLLC